MAALLTSAARATLAELHRATLATIANQGTSESRAALIDAIGEVNRVLQLGLAVETYISIGAWGVMTAGDLPPRDHAMRLLEEALELCDAAGAGRDTVASLVNRRGKTPPRPDGDAIEISADIVIRAVSLMACLNADLGGAIDARMLRNRRRGRQLFPEIQDAG